MKIAHLEAVRKSVTSEELDVLTDIFRTAKGTPAGVPAQRYRADHKQWHDIILRLESAQNFLKAGHNGATYEIRVFALPLINDVRAQTILDIIDVIFNRLKIIYDAHLSELRSLQEVIDGVQGNREDILVALHLMVDAHQITAGHTTGFPYCEEPKMGVSESVIQYPDFGRVLDEFYEWHITNPRRTTDSWRSSNPFVQTNDAEGFFSSRDVANPPAWFDKLEPEKKALIAEIDHALRAGSKALPTMGLRTLMESVMSDHIGKRDRFKDYLRDFQKAGYIVDQHASVIAMVVDAGSAAVHRAHFPNGSDLDACVEFLKNMMEFLYIHKPRMDAVAANTPRKGPPQTCDGAKSHTD